MRWPSSPSMRTTKLCVGIRWPQYPILSGSKAKKRWGRNPHNLSRSTPWSVILPCDLGSRLDQIGATWHRTKQHEDVWHTKECQGEYESWDLQYLGRDLDSGTNSAKKSQEPEIASNFSRSRPDLPTTDTNRNSIARLGSRTLVSRRGEAGRGGGGDAREEEDQGKKVLRSARGRRRRRRPGPGSLEYVHSCWRAVVTKSATCAAYLAYVGDGDV
jgi:hypothetical protein